jgi:hypothetical protein
LHVSHSKGIHTRVNEAKRLLPNREARIVDVRDDGADDGAARARAEHEFELTIDGDNVVGTVRADVRVSTAGRVVVRLRVRGRVVLEVRLDLRGLPRRLPEVVAEPAAAVDDFIRCRLGLEDLQA